MSCDKLNPYGQHFKVPYYQKWSLWSPVDPQFVSNISRQLYEPCALPVIHEQAIFGHHKYPNVD